MTLPTALRLAGILLAIMAAGSAASGLFTAVGTMAVTSSPVASMDFAILFLAGAFQSLWQAIVGGALALLCFAAARLLG